MLNSCILVNGILFICLNFSGPLPHCLDSVMLIPPCDRTLLERTFQELSNWAIHTMRRCLLDADMYFKAKAMSVPSQQNNNHKENQSIGVLPVSRFLLATLGLLSTPHQANSVSMLLNSGLLALTQTILRLLGRSKRHLY